MNLHQKLCQEKSGQSFLRLFDVCIRRIHCTVKNSMNLTVIVGGSLFSLVSLCCSVYKSEGNFTAECGNLIMELSGNSKRLLNFHRLSYVNDGKRTRTGKRRRGAHGDTDAAAAAFGIGSNPRGQLDSNRNLMK